MDKHEPDMPYFDILGRAQAAVFPNEELKAENFNLVNTEGFEKAVVLLKCWAEMTMREMLKEKNFRIEINYNAEAKKPHLQYIHLLQKNNRTVSRNIQKFNITFFNTECSGLKTLFEVWTGKSVVFYTVNQEDNNTEKEEADMAAVEMKDKKKEMIEKTAQEFQKLNGDNQMFILGYMLGIQQERQRTTPQPQTA